MGRASLRKAEGRAGHAEKGDVALLIGDLQPPSRAGHHPRLTGDPWKCSIGVRCLSREGHPGTGLHGAPGTRARWRTGNTPEAMGQEQRHMTLKMMMKSRRWQHGAGPKVPWNIAHSYTDWVPSVPRVADFSGLQTSPDHNSRKCAPPAASSPLAAARNHGYRPWSVFVETKQWLPRTLPLRW